MQRGRAPFCAASSCLRPYDILPGDYPSPSIGAYAAAKTRHSETKDMTSAANASKPKPPYRVLICDDMATVRRALQRVLRDDSDFLVVDEAASGQESVAKAKQLNPDLIVMDVHMPNLDGVEATRQILLGVPGTRVLAYSSDSAWATANRMLNAAARGYILKGTEPEEMVRAARTVLAGGHYLSPGLLEATNPNYNEQV